MAVETLSKPYQAIKRCNCCGGATLHETQICKSCRPEYGKCHECGDYGELKVFEVFSINGALIESLWLCDWCYECIPGEEQDEEDE